MSSLMEDIDAEDLVVVDSDYEKDSDEEDTHGQNGIEDYDEQGALNDARLKYKVENVEKPFVCEICGGFENNLQDWVIHDYREKHRKLQRYLKDFRDKCIEKVDEERETTIKHVLDKVKGIRYSQELFDVGEKKPVCGVCCCFVDDASKHLLSASHDEAFLQVVCYDKVAQTKKEHCKSYAAYQNAVNRIMAQEQPLTDEPVEIVCLTAGDGTKQWVKEHVDQYKNELSKARSMSEELKSQFLKKQELAAADAKGREVKAKMQADLVDAERARKAEVDRNEKKLEEKMETKNDVKADKKVDDDKNERKVVQVQQPEKKPVQSDQANVKISEQNKAKEAEEKSKDSASSNKIEAKVKELPGKENTSKEPPVPDEHFRVNDDCKRSLLYAFIENSNNYSTMKVESDLQKEIEKIKTPVIGVECLWMFNDKNGKPVFWLCSMCYVFGRKGDATDVIGHLKANKHVMNYIDLNYPDVKPSCKELKELMQEYTRLSEEIVEDRGIAKMKNAKLNEAGCAILGHLATATKIEATSSPSKAEEAEPLKAHKDGVTPKLLDKTSTREKLIWCEPCGLVLVVPLNQSEGRVWRQHAESPAHSTRIKAKAQFNFIDSNFVNEKAACQQKLDRLKNFKAFGMGDMIEVKATKQKPSCDLACTLCLTQMPMIQLQSHLVNKNHLFQYIHKHFPNEVPRIFHSSTSGNRDNAITEFLRSKKPDGSSVRVYYPEKKEAEKEKPVFKVPVLPPPPAATKKATSWEKPTVTSRTDEKSGVLVVTLTHKAESDKQKTPPFKPVKDVRSQPTPASPSKTKELAPSPSPRSGGGGDSGRVVVNSRPSQKPVERSGQSRPSGSSSVGDNRPVRPPTSGGRYGDRSPAATSKSEQNDSRGRSSLDTKRETEKAKSKDANKPDTEKEKIVGIGEPDALVNLLMQSSASKVELPVYAQEDLNRCAEPIIGANRVAEFECRDERNAPGYLCQLCKVRMLSAELVNHMISAPHRLKYMEVYYPTYHRNVQNYRKGRDVALKQYAAQVEVQENVAARRITQRLVFRVSAQILKEKKKYKPPSAPAGQLYPSSTAPPQVWAGPFNPAGYLGPQHTAYTQSYSVPPPWMGDADRPLRETPPTNPAYSSAFSGPEAATSWDDKCRNFLTKLDAGKEESGRYDADHLPTLLSDRRKQELAQLKKDLELKKSKAAEKGSKTEREDEQRSRRERRRSRSRSPRKDDRHRYRDRDGKSSKSKSHSRSRSSSRKRRSSTDRRSSKEHDSFKPMSSSFGWEKEMLSESKSSSVREKLVSEAARRGVPEAPFEKSLDELLDLVAAKRGHASMKRKQSPPKPAPSRTPAPPPLKQQKSNAETMLHALMGENQNASTEAMLMKMLKQEKEAEARKREQQASMLSSLLAGGGEDLLEQAIGLLTSNPTSGVTDLLAILEKAGTGTQQASQQSELSSARGQGYTQRSNAEIMSKFGAPGKQPTKQEPTLAEKSYGSVEPHPYSFYPRNEAEFMPSANDSPGSGAIGYDSVPTNFSAQNVAARPVQARDQGGMLQRDQIRQQVEQHRRELLESVVPAPNSQPQQQQRAYYSARDSTTSEIQTKTAGGPYNTPYGGSFDGGKGYMNMGGMSGGHSDYMYQNQAGNSAVNQQSARKPPAQHMITGANRNPIGPMAGGMYAGGLASMPMQGKGRGNPSQPRSAATGWGAGAQPFQRYP